MIFQLLCTIVGSLVSYIVYKWFFVKDDYYDKKGMKFIKSSGLSGSSVSISKTPPETAELYYNAFPKEKIIGFYDMTRKRSYFVRDTSLLKQLFVKDFDHFEDHTNYVDEKVNVLFGNSIISMTGQKWRDMRATLSPAFTGSKMKNMFQLVTECADDLSKHYQKKADSGEIIDPEMKDVFSRCTADMIASCAFGIKINSIEDPNNDFFVMGNKFMEVVQPGKLLILRFFLIKFLPKVAKFFQIELVDKKVNAFFFSTVLETMAIRERDNIIRPDLINILMQVRKGNNQEQTENERNVSNNDGFATVEESNIGKANVKRQWTDTEIVAQCFSFFLGGFDSSATLLTFVAYELAVNPDIQTKLFEEILELNKTLNGNRIDYDKIQKMKYMDQVISETLRKWPPTALLERKCVKDYSFDNGEISILIEKGQSVHASIYAMQHDPEYFPDPDKFDPERFSDENKGDILPGTYSPFGMGPRNCIGSRFALMEVKAIIYYLLLSFSFEPNKKTVIPLQLKRVPFSLFPANGLHLRLKPRK